MPDPISFALFAQLQQLDLTQIEPREGQRITIVAATTVATNSDLFEVRPATPPVLPTPGTLGFSPVSAQGFTNESLCRDMAERIRQYEQAYISKIKGILRSNGATILPSDQQIRDFLYTDIAWFQAYVQFYAVFPEEVSSDQIFFSDVLNPEMDMSALAQSYARIYEKPKGYQFTGQQIAVIGLVRQAYPTYRAQEEYFLEYIEQNIPSSGTLPNGSRTLPRVRAEITALNNRLFFGEGIDNWEFNRSVNCPIQISDTTTLSPSQELHRKIHTPSPEALHGAVLDLIDRNIQA